MDDIYDLLVIGGGPAGKVAAELRRPSVAGSRWSSGATPAGW
ncbi:hypothetical protein [Modestobacter marinus]|nr:hypothetical protein [Modestobacter marinus]